MSEARPRRLVNLEAIRTAHQGRLNEHASGAAPIQPLTVRATVHVVEDQLKEARVGQFIFRSDESSHLGGRGEAPSPLAYFVASVGFCLLTQFTRAAALKAIELDDLRVDVRASFPVEWRYGLGDASSACDRLVYTVDVATDASDETVAGLLRWAERACHVVNSLREPVRVDVTLRHNGVELSSSDRR